MHSKENGQSSIFKAWLMFFLVVTFGGMLIGLVVGAVVGAVLAAIDFDVTAIAKIAGIFGFLISVPISYAAFRWSVLKYILRPENGTSSAAVGYGK